MSYGDASDAVRAILQDGDWHSTEEIVERLQHTNAQDAVIAALGHWNRKGQVIQAEGRWHWHGGAA